VTADVVDGHAPPLTEEHCMEGRTTGPIDAAIGQRIRQRRMLLGMSQQKLADAMGLTFQQVQKYEMGKNRISASRLHRLAQILQIPVSHFFEGLEPTGTDSAKHSPFDGLDRAETLKLVRSYWAIPDETVRRSVFEFVRTVGKAAVTAD
jgi:transcriptional regulator with XRE-family HTH domain